MFNDIEDEISKIPINSTVECISKADIFQGTVLRVDEIEKKKKKKGKERKGNSIRSRNISDGFYHTCIKNTGRNS